MQVDFVLLSPLARWYCSLSSLVRYIGLIPDRWFLRLNSYFAISLVTIMTLKALAWPPILHSNTEGV